MFRTPLTLCAAITLGLVLLFRITRAVSEQLQELLNILRMDMTKR